MAKSRIFTLRFRGRVVQGAVGRGGWKITDPTSAHGGDIDWRVLLVAPDLGDLPVVLAEPADVRSLADQFKPDVRIPEQLRRTLGEALEPGTTGGARAVSQESDQALVEAHRCLRKEYQKLGEHEGLDLNSGDLFLCARQRKLFHSLTLHDEVNLGAPVPVLPLPDYLPNLLQVTGDTNWVASACSWDGLSALYETSEPKSGPPGRSLVLYGSDYRTDLRHLDTTKLNQPPGPPDPSPPEFVVQAAETTS